MFSCIRLCQCVMYKHQYQPYIGHYRGTGPLLVEKQVIVRKGDAYPIEQSAVARFKEGGHIEGVCYVDH